MDAHHKARRSRQDFADDIALLSSTKQHIQTKTDKLTHEAEKVGLKVKGTLPPIFRITIKAKSHIPIRENPKILVGFV